MTMQINFPIFGNDRRIVGWSRTAPDYSTGAPRHEQAEKALGGPITALPFDLTSEADIQTAGGLPTVTGICRADYPVR